MRRRLYRKKVDSVGQQGWAVGYGYDPSRVVDNPDLTRTWLDDISEQVPIFILNQSGHLAYANSIAFLKANIAAGTADPKYFPQKGNKLTGIILENGVKMVSSAISPTPSAEEMLQWISEALDNWIAAGCTTVFDAGIGVGGPQEVALYRYVKTPLRTFGAMGYNIIEKYLRDIPGFDRPPYYLGQFKVSAIKYWADGSTQGFTAALNEDYINTPSWSDTSNGSTNYPTTQALQSVVQPWFEKGWQIVIHSNGDRATDMVLDVYNNIIPQPVPDPPTIYHRIEHFTVTNKDQIAAAKKLELAVSHVIGHVEYWGDPFKDYVLGEPRANCIDPVKSDVEARLVWSLHSDSPVTPVSPLEYLRTATTRLTTPGNNVSGLNQAVDLQTALAGVTINPAKQIGIGDMVGTLEVGKKADFVVLDQDIRNTPTEKLGGVKVLQTWIGGQVVYINDKE